MYSNISQILLLYKMWWYYNKFDFTKSSRIYYWCVKIPQCGYMEHGLSYIIFYVQKHMKALTKCYNPNSRQAARTVGIYDTRLLAPLSNVNRPYSQIPQCTCPISLNTPFKIEMSTFLFWMVCCWTWTGALWDLWDWSIPKKRYVQQYQTYIKMTLYHINYIVSKL